MRARIAFLALAIAVTTVVVTATASANTPVSGAAFTTTNTNADGTGHCKNGNEDVNCNIYDGKQYVWLNGGPSTAYVGDGTYFFAVLAPGGQGGNKNPNDGTPKNLSDDYDAYTNRTFSVSGGAVSYGGTHDFDSNKIRLMPYADTPNPGGVYILATCSLADGYPVDPSDCKYDAFKIQEEEAPAAQAPDITKDAAGSNDRSFTWDIDKGLDPASRTIDAGQTATIHYTVTVSHDDGAVSNVAVIGQIQVFNFNVDGNGDTVPLQIDGVTDQLSDNTVCSVVGGGAQSLTLAETDFDFSCDLDDTLPSGQLDNTATVSWSDQTINGANLVGGSKSYTFKNISFAENKIDDCVTVSDSLQGTLGPVCVGDPNPKEFKYDRTVTGPPAGTCTTVDNTASFTTDDTGATDSASASAQVCSFGPRLTPGYWRNHLGSSANPNRCAGLSLPSGTSCSSNGPFTYAWANATQYKCLGGADNCTPLGASPYKVNSILKGAQVFAVMNCSNTGSNAQQNQNAVGCLAGHLLAAKYNRNINGSNPCINATIAAADALLLGIPYVGPSSTYTGIGTATRNSAISLKSALDAYNNGGGCH